MSKAKAQRLPQAHLFRLFYLPDRPPLRILRKGACFKEGDDALTYTTEQDFFAALERTLTATTAPDWSRLDEVNLASILKVMSFKILGVGQDREKIAPWIENPSIRVTWVDRLSQAPEPSCAYDLVMIEYPFPLERHPVSVRQFFPNPNALAPLILIFARDVESAEEEFRYLKCAFVKKF